ncbi:MAG: hypothetical protein ACTHWZ_07650 [Peptoniphilaceae bacterium]
MKSKKIAGFLALLQLILIFGNSGYVIAKSQENFDIINPNIQVLEKNLKNIKKMMKLASY